MQAESHPALPTSVQNKSPPTLHGKTIHHRPPPKRLRELARSTIWLVVLRRIPGFLQVTGSRARPSRRMYGRGARRGTLRLGRGVDRLLQRAEGFVRAGCDGGQGRRRAQGACFCRGFERVRRDSRCDQRGNLFFGRFWISRAEDAVVRAGGVERGCEGHSGGSGRSVVRLFWFWFDGYVSKYDDTLWDGTYRLDDTAVWMHRASTRMVDGCVDLATGDPRRYDQRY